MLNWIVRGLLIVAGVVASWFVTRDSPQFSLMQMAAVLLLIVLIVAILAFWPERFARILNGVKKQR
jgi:protein-S-isoprenylcysteine O-methyltransferase Ste14